MRRVLLTLVALFTLAVVGTSMIRTIRSFYGLDFPVTWEERGIRVEEVPSGSSAAVSALAVGDVITAVDTIAVERLVDPVFGLAAGSEHLIELLVVSHGVQLVEVDVIGA